MQEQKVNTAFESHFIRTWIAFIKYKFNPGAVEMLGGLRAFMSMGAMILTLLCTAWLLQRRHISYAALSSCWTVLYFCYSAELEQPFQKFSQQRVVAALRLSTWLLLLCTVIRWDWALWSLLWLAAAAGMASQVVSLQRQPVQCATFAVAVVCGAFLVLGERSVRTFAGLFCYGAHWHLTARKEKGVRRHLRDLTADLVILLLLPLLHGAGVSFFVKLAAMLVVWCALVAAIHMPVTLYSVV